jgi:hypothetical protein
MEARMTISEYVKSSHHLEVEDEAFQNIRDIIPLRFWPETQLGRIMRGPGGRLQGFEVKISDLDCIALWVAPFDFHLYHAGLEYAAPIRFLPQFSRASALIQNEIFKAARNWRFMSIIGLGVMTVLMFIMHIAIPLFVSMPIFAILTFVLIACSERIPDVRSSIPESRPDYRWTLPDSELVEHFRRVFSPDAPKDTKNKVLPALSLVELA